MKTVLISMIVGAAIGLGLMGLAIIRDDKPVLTPPTVTVCSSTQDTGTFCESKP